MSVVRVSNEKNIERDIKKNWSIKGRSLEKALVCLKKSTINKKKGYKNKPLFPFIKFYECVVDLLHLTLRITDKLFSLLIYRLEELDANFSSKLIQVLRDFMENECKISNPFQPINKSKNESLKLRKLNQNERIKLFNELYGKERTLASIFPLKFQSDPTILSLSRLFPNFFEYLNKMKKIENLSLRKKEKLVKKLKNWLKIFIDIEPKITPYIHIFVFHLPEFLEAYPNINLFSMQSLEKKNHSVKLNYYFQTNRKDCFSKILLQKMNRLDLLRLNEKILN